MSTSGSEVLLVLTAAIEKAARGHEALQCLQRQALQQFDASAVEHCQVPVEFALHSPETRSCRAVRQVWDEVQSKIQDLPARREAHLQILMTQHEQLDLKQAQLRTDLQSLDRELAIAANQRDELSRQLSEQLSSDAAFEQLTDEAAVAEINLQRGEAALAEAEHEVIAKLPGYHRSRLFRYLDGRKLGTAQYRGWGVRRRIDHWVSRMIDYPKARKGYQSLSEAPDQMRELIAQRRHTLYRLLDRLESHQQAVSAELGFDQVLERLRRNEMQRDDLLDAIEATVLESDDTTLQIDRLLDREGPFCAEQLDQFKRLLKQLETLTPELNSAEPLQPADEPFAVRLKQFREEIQRFENEVDQHRSQLRKSRQFAASMNTLAQRFQRARFDAARSYFDDGLNLGDLIESLRDRRQEPEQVWQHIRRHQHTAPNWYEEHSRRIFNPANSPMSRILLQTMAHAASAPLRESARRAGSRRMHHPPQSIDPVTSLPGQQPLSPEPTRPETV